MTKDKSDVINRFREKFTQESSFIDENDEVVRKALDKVALETLS